ncbi:hypothetical protein [Ferruginibacter sp. HRS2-29]|uniref:hypothetical protein n=1 Tax=Ferruginibacter sp. HRS2-29 TaxID=2487334 RepID=UPI0020CD949B|nr:hypothetical protein [Ferruginibacter sp. HRS2-29]
MKNNKHTPAKNPAIMFLVIANTCIIEHAFTKSQGTYQYLWFTIPLLILCIFYDKISLRKKAPVRQLRSREYWLRPHLFYHSEKVRNS